MAGLVVDSHVHIFPDSVHENLTRVRAIDAWFAACHPDGCKVASVNDLLKAMDDAHVDRAICFTWPFVDSALCREANDYLAAVVCQHPDRLTGFATVQPGDPSAPDEVHRCVRLGLRGVGELNADAQGWSLEDSDVMDPLMAVCTAEALPFTLHCSEPVGHLYAGKGKSVPSRVLSFAERYPDVHLIYAHLGGGLPLYAHMPEIFEVAQHLWFDTAAVPFLYRKSIYRAIIDACGVSRLLFGSDFPLVQPQRYLDDLASVCDRTTEYADVVGGNATRLFQF